MLHRLNRLAPLVAAIAAATALLAAGCGDDAEPVGDPASAAADSTDLLDPTPTQAEGPYYPREIPADHDSDLRVVDGGTPAAGTALALSGTLTDLTGEPIAGATIEIWQADRGGVYLHPDDPRFDQYDQDFQGYGRATTDSAGAWSFQTVDPGHYELRPRHVHLRVLEDDVPQLTSQIYFSDDPFLSDDQIAAGAGDRLNLLVADAVPQMGPDGARTLAATHRLVIDR